MNIDRKNWRLHLFLLFCWILIGSFLRFTNLELKSPWADEWATLVFSLGNSFLTVPLEKIIDIDTILQPLQLTANNQTGDVINHLMNESTHPPIYFILTHLWLKLFSSKLGLVSVEVARSLSAFFGILSIPLMFWFGWLVSGSILVGQFASGLMAVSPYGIYLAQETRHYTFVLLLIIASLSCLIIAIKNILHEDLFFKPSIIFYFIWIVINSLGVATHYFFCLTLATEVLVLLGFFYNDIKQNNYSKNFTIDYIRSSYKILLSRPWRNIVIAILGTIAGCSIWFYRWLTIPSSQLTDWIKSDNFTGINFLEPLFRLTGWITTMVILLPIEGTPLIITIISSIFLLLIFIWLSIAVIKFFRKQKNLAPDSLIKTVIFKYLLWAIILVLTFVYLAKRDLTLAARFQFFYFPTVIIIIAGVFSNLWQQNKILSKKIIILTLITGLLGGISVINNYAYQKSDRADIVVSVMKEAQQINPTIPILITTIHKTHEQTGEIMGLAWEWQKTKSPLPKFLLLHKDGGADPTPALNNLDRNLNKLPRPLDMWVVNFSAPTDNLPNKNCFPDESFKRRTSGYRYRLYHCS